MIKKLFFNGLICSIICLFSIQVNGQNTANYTFSSATNGSLIDMSSGSVELIGSSSDDGVSSITEIGFEFIFMGSRYTQFSVNANGLLRLGSTVITGAYTNDLTTTTNVPQIVPYWDDLATGTNGKVHYKVTEAPPNRVLAIEWRVTVPRNTFAAYNATFQCLLYENEGKIEFIYGNGLGVNSGGYSIGFSTSSGSYASVASSTSTCSYNSNESTNKSQTGAIANQTIYAFTPPAAPTAPTNLTLDNITLTQMRLNWTDATDETGYLIYYSTDGVNYNLLTQVAANTTNYTATSLSASTTYYWKIYAVNEGRISVAALQGSQATNACAISGTKTIGASGDDYPTITAAINDIVNNGMAGAVILKLQSDYNPSSETFPINITQIPCASATNTLTIMPDAGVAVNITSNNTTATLQLNGADHVIIDGRQNGTGAASSLTIDNTATGTASTIKFLNDATNNIIKYCNITGSSSNTNAGVVWFSTSTGTTGNDNNTIEYCDIHANANTPYNCIYASGTAGKSNDNITIQNCKIYDFFVATADHCGIKVVAKNTNWFITNNSFYETTSRNITGSSIEWNAIQLSDTSVAGFTINNNYIGGQSANCGGSAMTLTGSGVLRAFKIQQVSTSNPCNINANIFKNINFTTSNTSTVQSLIAVNTGGANIGTTSGNILGDAINPITFTYSNTTSGIFFNPVFLGTGTLGDINISNNTIKEINVTFTSTGSCGIKAISLSGSASSLIVSNNLIFNLTNSYSGATTSSATIGIFSNASTNNAIIEKNNIFNLSINSTSTASPIYGIQLNNTNTTICKNNMIRLGYDKYGAELTTGYNIYGIYETTAYNYVVHNNVYLNGNVSGTTSATYAFYATTTVNTRYYQNNILVNLRNGGTTGKHAAIYLPSTSGLNCDYNIYYALNSGNNYTAVLSATNYTSLQAWRYDIRAVNGDLHSTIADPRFIAPTATTPNLHIQTGVATPVEGSGIAISGITDDFDGDVRSAATPTDIGADAGNFNSLDDKFTPNISYTLLSNGSGSCSSSRTFTATITDVGTGLPVSGGNVPRVWFNKNGGTWYSTAGTLSSGNGNNGGWNFSINYTTLGGVANSDIIRYYVVAQDQAATPNIWYTAFEAATPAHSNVNTQTTPPTTPNSYTIVPSLSGTVTVGTGGDYTTLTGAGGLFETINNGVVTGNIIASIISNITETGANSLNQWIEDCGNGYALTIKPSSASEKIIEGSLSSSSVGLINFNNADRVIIDGAYNGSGKYLRLRNISTGGWTINYAYNASNDTLRNCIIESGCSSSTKGVICIAAGASISDACRNIYIDNCEIKEYSTSYPNFGVYINSKYTSNVTIKNCTISNWVRQGVSANSAGDSITIDGCHFFTSQTYSTQKAVQIYRDGSVDGKGHVIKNNFIGGQAASCGGSALLNATTGASFYGIELDCGNGIASQITGNTIKNIAMNQTTATYFYGIYAKAGQGNTGLVEIKNNNIGSATHPINVAGTGSYEGITNLSGNGLNLIDGNTICYIQNSNVGTSPIRGINNNIANIRKNKIFKIGSTGASTANIAGIYLNNSVALNYEVSNNMISLEGISAGNPTTLYGIYNYANTSGTIYCSYNSIYVFGAATGSNNSGALYRGNFSNNFKIFNNILISNRSGSTGAHFALGTQMTSGWASNYNLTLTTSSSVVGRWNITNYNINDWKSNSNSDKSTWCALASVGSTDYANLNPADLFVDAANGDLSINTANAAAWYVFGKGVAGEQSNNIVADFYGNERAVTSGMATCIGAHEFAQPAVAPISANASGAPAAGTTTTYTFGNRTICSIDWAAGSNVPASVDVKYYSGVNPQNPTPGDAQYHNAFVRVTATGGTEPFNYTMNLYYDTAFRGTVTKNADTRLSKYNTFWTTYNETSSTQSAGAVYYISKGGLTNFSDFTCSDMDHVLPVELLVFKAFADDAKVKLYWSTASETNNQYFIIEHSSNAQDWQAITQVDGNGNSNQVLNYSAVDSNPFHGINYYRLKQVDFDGQYAYSEVVSVNLASNQNSVQEKWNITLFPNPVVDVLRIKAEQIDADNFQVRIFTVAGTIVKTENWEINDSEMLIIEMMVQDLQPGMYFVEFTDGKQSQILRMVKK